MNIPSLAGRRLEGLQVLRFLAAFSVLFGHTLHEMQSFDVPSAALEPFYFGDGVDVFFVISGFIMFYVCAGQFGLPGAQKAFLGKRFVRLVPLYWLFTAAMVLAIVLVPGDLTHSVLSLPHVLASFAFVPWLDSTGLAHPVLGLGWTLNYEMFFYLLFSFALLAPRRVGLLALTGAFVLLVAVNPLLPPGLVQLKFWTDPIILEFLFGIGIAMAVVNRVRLPRWAPAALLAAGAAGLLLGSLLPGVDGFGRPLLVGVPAALLVAGAAFGTFTANSRAGRWLVLGGDASYALYLSHPFSIHLVEIVWRKLHLGGGPVLIGAALAVAVAASIFVHLALERPLTRWLNRRRAERPAPAVDLGRKTPVNAGE